MRRTLALLLAAAACTGSDEPTAPALDNGVRHGGKADDAFAAGPMYLTGAFDGSQRFGMWVDTMAFARKIEADFGKHLGFTYFINTAYYDKSVKNSWIGTSMSDRESIVRWALTQQAINEGHEIGDHSVRHQDGGKWTAAQWRKELTEFHALTAKNLFYPVVDDDGVPVFPRWQPAPLAGERKVGAECSENADCDSGQCLHVAPDHAYCTQACNSKKKCPNDTICGTPTFNDDTDVCVPMPAFPVEFGGEELFNADGAANLSAAALEPYQVVGFRAPQLANNRALYEVLTELGYRYDTSMVLPPGPPARTVRGVSFPTIFQFGLMKNPGSLIIPMDYNYKVVNGSGARMKADYRKSIVDAYARGRQPWNIGHHFALWQNGAYWAAMQDAFTFAAQGCPDAGGAKKCAEIEFPTFLELAGHLDGKADSAQWDDASLEDYVIDEAGDAGEDSH